MQPQRVRGSSGCRVYYQKHPKTLKGRRRFHAIRDPKSESFLALIEKRGRTRLQELTPSFQGLSTCGWTSNHRIRGSSIRISYFPTSSALPFPKPYRRSR
jgi:hypothetical protein